MIGARLHIMAKKRHFRRFRGEKVQTGYGAYSKCDGNRQGFVRA